MYFIRSPVIVFVSAERFEFLYKTFLSIKILSILSQCSEYRLYIMKKKKLNHESVTKFENRVFRTVF